MRARSRAARTPLPRQVHVGPRVDLLCPPGCALRRRERPQLRGALAGLVGAAAAQACGDDRADDRHVGALRVHLARGRHV
eukprot:6404660-Prymnesium_polylepis.1